MWNYSEKLKDHFFNPRNVGAIENPSGVGEVGSLSCGDALKLYIKVENNRIMDAKFQTFGCGSAIASASALTEMIRGKTLEEAAAITNQDIAEYLDGLPPEKMHCSVMGREALEAAIANYKGEPPPKDQGEVVCKCFGVTEEEIVRAVRENDLSGVDDVTNYTKAGGGCGHCRDRIAQIVGRVRGQTAQAPSAKPQPRGKLTNLQRIKLIEETIEQEIRPALRRDGGDIVIEDIDGPNVRVTMLGQCSNCPSAGATLSQYVEARLRELVDPAITVSEAR